MHVDPYERTWIIVSVLLLVLFFAAVTVAGLAMGIRVPGPVARVNPNTVAQEGPFAEPGLRELAPGKYEAYVLARTWQYQPRELTVPVGSTVTFFVTSPDVQHGFKIQDTNANMMVIPGQITSLTVHFTRPGEYEYICTEYCGLGHGAMFGKVIVTP
ncbi:MAG: cytochrome C oxidase subunit II [Chloroflexi bacterium]|nr:cytochrome C oxidase subunit II [Chloroflexota bacterium]